MDMSHVDSEIQTSGGIHLHVIYCLYYLPLLKPETDPKTHKNRMQDCPSVQNQNICNHL